MSATPTEEQLQDVQTAATEEVSQDATAAVASVDEAFEAAEDLGIPEDVPTADDPQPSWQRNLDEGIHH